MVEIPRVSRRFASACLLLMVGGVSAVGANTDNAKAVPLLPGVELETIAVEPPEPQFVAPTSRDRIGRIWAPVLIDGKGPYRLVLDTGASRSAVTERTASTLGSVQSADASARVTGFTGTTVVPTIQVASLEIGDFALGPTRLPVLADVFGGADGVLSLNGMTRERFFADFAHDRLEISRSHDERAPSGFDVVPLRMVRGLPSIHVRIGNIDAMAIVDTGAQLSVGNLALREALAQDTASATAREDIVGVTLDTQSGDRIPSPAIRLGRLTIQNMSIVYGDMHLFREWGLTRKPALIVAMDLLGSFDVVVIDYARREMQVRPRVAVR